MALIKYLKAIPLKIIILTAMLIAALLVFGFIVHESLSENETEFDMMVFQYFQEHIIDSRLTPVMEAVSFLGSSKFQIAVYTLLVSALLIRRKTREALDIAVIGITGYIIMDLLKNLFQRARPANPLIDTLKSYSFPSGHASTGFIFYGLIIFLIWKTQLSNTLKWILSILLVLLSILIGISRVYLRVHYASDVIAGFCLGYTWLTLSLFVLNHLNKKHSTKH